MTRRDANTRRFRARRGLTLIELLIAVSITAMVGVAIATVMTAAGNSLSRVGEVRSALQRAHAMHTRLSAYTDAALCVLDEAPKQGFAVWLHDENPGGTINLSELRIIWYDTGEEEISVEWVTFPDDWTPQEVSEADRELEVGADYYTEMLTKRGEKMTSRLTLADGVVSEDLSHEADSYVDAERLRAEATLRLTETETETMLFTIGIENHTVPN